jgi:hypothetical protein
MNELSGRRLREADLATGLVLAFLGAAGLAMSYAMPSFAERGADPLTAPGIFPGVVSLVLLGLGSGLLVRSAGWLRHYPLTPHEGAAETGGLAGLAIGLTLMVVTVSLVGRIDLKLLLVGFCLAYSVWFVSWTGSVRQRAIRLATVAFVALIAGVLIPTVFERLFLVRLP